MKSSRTIDPAEPITTTSSRLRVSFVQGSVVFLAATLIDILIAAVGGRWSGLTISVALVGTTLVLSHAALLGAAFGLIVGAIQYTVLRMAGERRFVRLFIWWFLASVLFFVFSRDILNAHTFRRLPAPGVLSALMTAMGSFGLLLVLVLLPHVRQFRDSGFVSGISARFVGLVLGTGCLLVNARFLVGQYSAIHRFLVAGGIFLLWFICEGMFVFPKFRRTLTPVVCGLILFGFVIQPVSTAAAYRAAAYRGSPFIREFLPLSAPVFRILAPDETRRVVVPNLEFTNSAEDREKIRIFLRDTLGDERNYNVVVLSLDTVRADRLGFMGYKRGTTPHLDALAEKSFVFTRAYTTYPTSRFAYASLWSALFPGATPANAVIRRGQNNLQAEWTFPHLMSTEGWVSVARTSFSRESAADPRQFHALRAGFNDYAASPSAAFLNSREVVDETLAAMSSHVERPLLVWMHFFDPHDTYDTRAGFEFGTTDSDRYDSEIAAMDADIGRFVEELRFRNEFDNTLFVIHSDHGEAFGEHGTFYHDSSLYEEQVRVPLFLVIPHLEGRRILSPVSLVDVLPTVLEVLGLKDSRPRHGKSLVPLMFGAESTTAPPIYNEFFGSGAAWSGEPMASVIRWPMKLILRRHSRVMELYNLESDPVELKNLIGLDPVLDAELSSLLAGLMESARPR